PGSGTTSQQPPGSGTTSQQPLASGNQPIANPGQQPTGTPVQSAADPLAQSATSTASLPPNTTVEKSQAATFVPNQAASTASGTTNSNNSEAIVDAGTALPTGRQPNVSAHPVMHGAVIADVAAQVVSQIPSLSSAAQPLSSSPYTQIASTGTPASSLPVAPASQPMSSQPSADTATPGQPSDSSQQPVTSIQGISAPTEQVTQAAGTVTPEAVPSGVTSIPENLLSSHPPVTPATDRTSNIYSQEAVGLSSSMAAQPSISPWDSPTASHHPDKSHSSQHTDAAQYTPWAAAQRPGDEISPDVIRGEFAEKSSEEQAKLERALKERDELIRKDREEQERQKQEREEQRRRELEEQAKRDALLALLAARKAKEQAEKALEEKIRREEQEHLKRRRAKYVVVEGDTLESIAQKMLQDQSLAPLIFEINRQVIPSRKVQDKLFVHLKPKQLVYLPLPEDIKKFRLRPLKSRTMEFRYVTLLTPTGEQSKTNDSLQEKLGSESKTSPTAEVPSATQTRRQNIESLLGSLSGIADESGRIKYCVRLGDTLESIAIKHPALQDVGLWKLVAEINNLTTDVDSKGSPLVTVQRGQVLSLPSAEEIANYRKSNAPLIDEAMIVHQFIRQLGEASRLVSCVCELETSKAFTKRLEVLNDNNWLPVILYEMSSNRCMRYEFMLDGSRKTKQIDLPLHTVNELALNELSSGAEQLREKFLSGKSISD
ncbi:MAG: LysM peptidoglycan-binding domain-containing protein, partial [Candidatus Melainabacteria bacterium]|nr:LysM peptidoglycan-binding domain-containing protein [Candidatus Melainabacteria bacterium]